MSKIVISNVVVKGLTPLDFYNNRNLHKFSVHDGTSTLVPVYKELLHSVIGNFTNQAVYDIPLTVEQTASIKTIFEKQLDETIPKRISTDKPPSKIIQYKGKTYELDFRLTNPIDRMIDDYYIIVNIAEECLRDNKPMHITVE